MWMCRVTTTAGKSTPKLFAWTAFQTFVRFAFGMIIGKMFTGATYGLCSIEGYVMIAGTFATWHTAWCKNGTSAWNLIEISFMLFVSTMKVKIIEDELRQFMWVWLNYAAIPSNLSYFFTFQIRWHRLVNPDPISRDTVFHALNIMIHW